MTLKALPKILVILGLGLTALILLVTMMVRPLLTEVTTANEKVHEKKVELDILKQQIRAFKNAQADLDKASRKEDLLKAIPTKEELVLSVLDMEKAAGLTNTETLLEISEVVAANTKDKKQVPPVIPKKVGIEEVQYDLDVKNDFTGIVNFVSYLEHLPHFTEISKLSLKSELTPDALNSTFGRTGMVTGTLNGVFFIKTQK
jgi:Tfp pilus assembly protein PilO